MKKSKNRSRGRSASRGRGRSASRSRGRSQSVGNNSKGKKRSGNRSGNRSASLNNIEKKKDGKHYREWDKGFKENNEQILTQDEFNKTKEILEKMWKDRENGDNMISLKEIEKEIREQINESNTPKKEPKKAPNIGGAGIPLLAPVPLPQLTDADTNLWGIPGKPAWPGFYGCDQIINAASPCILLPFKIVDRFGGSWGHYLGLPIASYRSRSMSSISVANQQHYIDYYTTINNKQLPPRMQYHKYYTRFFIPTNCCRAAAVPQFDTAPGGAMQYMIPAKDPRYYSYNVADAAIVETDDMEDKMFYKIDFLLKWGLLGEFRNITTFPTWN